jgi:hypothetical protein
MRTELVTDALQIPLAHRQRYRKVRRRLATSLGEDQAAGRVPEDVDVEALAAVPVAVMDGLRTQWLLDPEVDMVRAFQAFAGLVRRDDAARIPPPAPSGSDGAASS